MLKREIEIKPTVKELAQEFCDLGADEQVSFLVEVTRVFRSWGAYRRDHQLLSIGEELRAAGDYASEVVRILAAESFRVPEEELKAALLAWGERLRLKEKAKP